MGKVVYLKPSKRRQLKEFLEQNDPETLEFLKKYAFGVKLKQIKYQHKGGFKIEI